MTREEAIEWLKHINITDFGWDDYAMQESQREIRERCEQGVREAIDMAIEALTEPINCVKCKHYYETEDDTDVHGHCRMDTAHTNLISRADALRELNGACSNWKDDCKVAEIINALPSAEAVSIHENGTLEVKVPNAHKVGRVLVIDADSHIGGGLFYPDDSVRGKWIFNPKDAIELMFTKPKCSECGFESSDGGNFCSNCGARMKGGAEE